MTREEAILCLKGMKNYARDTFTEQADWQDSLDMAIEALEAEPKHGWWGRWKDKPISGFATVRCSICGTAYLENNGRWNYCPNCGARMDGGKK